MDAYSLTRPLLFALPSEAAHACALAALRRPWLLPARPASTGRALNLAGMTFRNRLGVAAGLDKDGVAVGGLVKLGFGFVEVGTVTPLPQAGNPKPRLFRLSKDGALVNRLGFNSAGGQAGVANLRRYRIGSGADDSVPVGVNIGKNRQTPLVAAEADYLACFRAVREVADFVTVNVSSPNTPGLRALQERDAVDGLVRALATERDSLAVRHGRAPPILVKVSPDVGQRDLEATATAALAAGAGGLVAVNTTVARPPSLRSKRAWEAGGLSGRPLLETALEALRRLRACVGDDALLIGVGGVSRPADMRAMLDAGADLVQVYTGLVYEGPALVRRLLAAPTG